MYKFIYMYMECTFTPERTGDLEDETRCFLLCGYYDDKVKNCMDSLYRDNTKRCIPSRRKTGKLYTQEYSEL